MKIHELICKKTAVLLMVTAWMPEETKSEKDEELLKSLLNHLDRATETLQTMKRGEGNGEEVLLVKAP